MISSSTPLRTEKGFALLDMLVGIAALGLFMSVLVASISFVTHQQGLLRKRQEARESALAVKRLMNSLVNSAPVLARPEQRPDLFGSDTTFSIRSMGPAALALPEPGLFRIAVTPRDRGIDLVASWIDPQANSERHRTIARGLAEASFTYLVRDPNQVRGRWLSVVPDGSERIEAVRLTLRTVEANSTIQIITPVRSEVAALCANPVDNPVCRARTP